MIDVLHNLSRGLQNYDNKKMTQFQIVSFFIGGIIGWLFLEASSYYRNNKEY